MFLMILLRHPEKRTRNVARYINIATYHFSSFNFVWLVQNPERCGVSIDGGVIYIMHIIGPSCIELYISVLKFVAKNLIFISHTAIPYTFVVCLCGICARKLLSRNISYKKYLRNERTIWTYS